MANWSDLKAAIAQVIRENGNQGITGSILQNALNSIISNVGKDCSFAGIATPATNPGTPDGNVFYLATEAGTYANFSGIEIETGEAVILEWRGSWVKKTSGFATQKQLSELDKRTTELNISYLYPTSGVGETNKYTLAGAIAQVESKYRKAGLKVTFVNESNNTETWEYLGGSWRERSFSEVGARRFAEQDTKFSELEFSNISIQSEATIDIGTRSKVIIIKNTLYAKGKIKITVDKSNFPSGITYNGCQIRDNNGTEITTRIIDEFEIDSFTSEGRFSVGFYFKEEVQSNVIIPFTVKVLYGSPYDKETRNMVISNKEETDKYQENNSEFIPSYSKLIYNYKLINMFVGTNGAWQRYVGKGKSILIPTDNIKKLYIIGNLTLNSSYSQLSADLNIKQGQLANITPGTEFTNLELGEYKVVEIAPNTKYISISVNDDNGNDRKPYYIGAEYIKNENDINYKELVDYSDYDETIQDALIGSTYWWQSGQTVGCEVVKINIQGYNKIRILNNRGVANIVGAILKDSAIQINNAPLPFADGITERFIFTDTIPHDIDLPYDAKYLYIDAQSRGNNVMLPYIQLIKDQSSTIKTLNNKIKEANYYNVGKETTTERFENFRNFEIVGISPTLSIIKDSSGSYYTPPIEISGGIISNVTVIEDGGITEKSAYCVHSDSNNNIDNKLVVDNCIFDSNSNSCWGVGTRKNYEMIFRNCVFIQRGTVDSPTTSGDTSSWYSHNTTSDKVLTKEQKSKIKFWNCLFISETGEPMYIQDWSASDSDAKIDFCEFEFIGCNFAWQGNTEDAVKIDYKAGTQELNSKEFKRHFMLSNKSTGNNVSWLNVNVVE